MNTKQFIKELIKIFADKTTCSIQYNNCPCNSCFHSINADFNHISWLILLALRGDCNKDREQILEEIKEEINVK